VGSPICSCQREIGSFEVKIVASSTADPPTGPPLSTKLSSRAAKVLFPRQGDPGWQAILHFLGRLPAIVFSSPVGLWKLIRRSRIAFAFLRIPTSGGRRYSQSPEKLMNSSDLDTNHYPNLAHALKN
jgi:hypothetical protein